MAEGAGAWMNPRNYKLTSPLLGISTTGESNRVNLAIRAIQNELQRRHCYPGSIDGIFGPITDQGVRQFQTKIGSDVLGPIDGIVGPRTARELWRPLIVWHGVFNSVPPEYLAGLIRHESLYDPGAEGELHPQDVGLAQINLAVHSVTPTQAFDPRFSILWAAGRLYQGYVVYGRWEIAIAAHNSPVKAQQWWQNGEPPDDQIRKYVLRILAGW